MEKELYFEVRAEGGGSRIYKITKPDGTVYFTDSHAEMVVDNEDGEVVLSESNFDSFEAFWNDFLTMRYWFKLNAYNIHDEIKPLVKRSIEQKKLELDTMQDKPSFLRISESWFEGLGMITNENDDNK